MTMKRTLVIALVAVAAVAAASFAYAAIPSANGTISACKDSKGALKVIDAEAGNACNGNQQLLTWNQQGPQGPPGPAGEDGSQIGQVAVHADGSLWFSSYGSDLTPTPSRVSTGVYDLAGSQTLQQCGKWVQFASGPRTSAIAGVDLDTFRVSVFDHNGDPTDWPFIVYFAC
jgi:hypothetical protein